MAFPTEPCSDCKKPLIKAATDKGAPVVVDADPVVGGRYRLTARTTIPLAAPATAKLAFGVALYTAHTCTGRRWRKR